jgi:hypothetical protein
MILMLYLKLFVGITLILLAMLQLEIRNGHLEDENARLTDVAANALADKWQKDPSSYPYHFNMRPRVEKQ